MPNQKNNNPKSMKEDSSSKNASQTNVQNKKANSDQNESTSKTEQAGFSQQRKADTDQWRTGVDSDGVTAGNP